MYLCQDCISKPIARGIKEIKCMYCGKKRLVNALHLDVCNECSLKKNICQKCGNKKN
ncbi:MAG: hypothetical protein ACOC2W_00875 [bacterium]